MANDKRTKPAIRRVRELPAAGQRISTCLARAGAPTGRPLRDDEWLEVSWTVAAPGDKEIGSKVARRQHRLLRLVDEATRQGAVPTVHDLAWALDASPATIKRDLSALRAEGHRVITRGSRRNSR